MCFEQTGLDKLSFCGPIPQLPDENRPILGRFQNCTNMWTVQWESIFSIEKYGPLFMGHIVWPILNEPHIWIISYDSYCIEVNKNESAKAVS